VQRLYITAIFDSSLAFLLKMIIKLTDNRCLSHYFLTRFDMANAVLFDHEFTDSPRSIHRDRASDQHLSLIYCSLFDTQLSLCIMQYLLLDFCFF